MTSVSGRTSNRPCGCSASRYERHEAGCEQRSQLSGINPSNHLRPDEEDLVRAIGDSTHPAGHFTLDAEQVAVVLHALNELRQFRESDGRRLRTTCATCGALNGMHIDGCRAVGS